MGPRSDLRAASRTEPFLTAARYRVPCTLCTAEMAEAAGSARLHPRCLSPQPRGTVIYRGLEKTGVHGSMVFILASVVMMEAPVSRRAEHHLRESYF